MMDEAGDCSTDGTCEADSGDPDMAGGGPMGGKGASLLQGTNLAIQQFSISELWLQALFLSILMFWTTASGQPKGRPSALSKSLLRPREY